MTTDIAARPGSVRAVLRLAQSRTRTSVGDRAYLVYMTVLVGLVCIGPVLRAAWILLAERAAIAAVAALPLVWTGAAALGAVGAALILGAAWGPAVRSPWLTRLLADAPITRARAFGAPLARTIMLAAVLATTCGAVVIGPAALAGAVSAIAGACALVACGLTGVVIGAALLVGQALGSRAHLCGAGLIAVAAGLAATGMVPRLAAIAWLAMAPATLALAVAATVAAGCIASIPAMLRSLRTADLIAASQRAATAMQSAVSFDVGTITGIARSTPTLGRHLSAVALRGPRWLVFLRRDAVGALRTPDRILLAMVGLAAAAVLATAAVGFPWLGAAAGIIWFLSLAPLTDGARHASTVAVGPPLYGISTAHLATLHALLPSLVSLATAALAGAVSGSAAALAATSAIAVGATLMRIADAAKPHLPEALLTPIPTPMGDMGALVRLLWASDGVLLAAGAGAAAAVATSGPWWLAAAIASICMFMRSRWRSPR